MRDEVQEWGRVRRTWADTYTEMSHLDRPMRPEVLSLATLFLAFIAGILVHYLAYT